MTLRTAKATHHRCSGIWLLGASHRRQRWAALQLDVATVYRAPRCAGSQLDLRRILRWALAPDLRWTLLHRLHNGGLSQQVSQATGVGR